MSILEIENLTYRYPDGVEALRGVNLAVEAGECLAIVGPNGAGKSTLFAAILGFIEARGRVRAGGVELARATRRDIRRRVGLVFQNADDQLFMPTVFDDVAFGPLCQGLDEAEVRRRVSQALEEVGALDLAERAPYHLSEGEKRRAALATVLAMRPEVILFDEPSANLDGQSRRRLAAILKGLPRTRILATHDLDLALEVSSRAALMAGGRIVAQGPPAEILADASLLQEFGLAVPPRLAAQVHGTQEVERLAPPAQG